MTNREKLHSGQIYYPSDDEIMKEQLLCLEKLYEFNATRPLEQEKRENMLKEMFAEIGEGCYIEPPLHTNWGGKHVHFGKMVYANFNLTMVDDTHIYVGDYTLIGPNVTIATAGHPIDPDLRAKAYQFNRSIRIGNNCWIGAGAIILPGVTTETSSLRHSSARAIPSSLRRFSSQEQEDVDAGGKQVEGTEFPRPIP